MFDRRWALSGLGLLALLTPAVTLADAPPWPEHIKPRRRPHVHVSLVAAAGCSSAAVREALRPRTEALVRCVHHEPGKATIDLLLALKSPLPLVQAKGSFGDETLRCLESELGHVRLARGPKDPAVCSARLRVVSK